MTNFKEEKYLKALSKGEIKAFDMLFLHYHPKLVYFIVGFLKNEEQAKDMAQDIFIDIWNKKDRLTEIKSFKAYIFRMAKNMICNYFDHIVVDEKYISEQLSKDKKYDNVEEDIFAEQLQDLIDVTVELMPPRRQQIFIMSRIKGMPNALIAKKLNINKRTVENHLTAALSSIKKAIRTYLLFFI